MSTQAATGARTEVRRIQYDDSIVRWFVFASIGWGIVAMLVGAIAALELAFWKANVTQYFSFGRLRPLHTNAAIFAFVGNMMFACFYYSTQRLVKQRVHSGLGKVHFWGWQLIIVAAAVTLPLGITAGKEYAELEWPIDLSIAAVWVVFAVNFFWTLWRRNEKQLYVALWFYIATIVTVAVLHITNSLAIPVTALKSYSIYGGAQDALVQWWYGHNAVAFFLTTPILGIMYYFVPKAVERPVFSYRLSIIHFWALVFMYIWAGPHHLLNSVLPDWAQTLGMIFSVALIAPSWGGMLNGLFTMRGAWDKVWRDPVLKFFFAALTFYGMSTFEGPLLSIKSVNAIAHYSDWIIGHVHSGALGWNGLMAAAMFYYLVPRLFGTELYSTRAAEWHFWLGTVGILIYVVSMWVSGIQQGLMWRAFDAKGALAYPNFVETLNAIKPMYWARLAGGTMYLIGHCIMAWNLVKTAIAGKPVDVEVEVVVEVDAQDEAPATKIVLGSPVVVSAIVVVLLAGIALTNAVGAGAFMLLAFFVAAIGAFVAWTGRDPRQPGWHALVEGRALLFTVLTVIAVLIGGAAEIIPALVIPNSGAGTAGGGKDPVHPYRPLELEGRDLYIKEGCYNCHSQMIRPFRYESARYGAISTLDDSKYDHPFQWGSKRTGPDLARLGGKYPNLWHYQHMIDPRTVSPGSNMPNYGHLAAQRLDYGNTTSKLRAMRAVGVPYTPEMIQGAVDDAKVQAKGIADDLAASGVAVAPESELVAMIAYLQRLGQNTPPPAPAQKGAPVSVNP
jgi:cytochrome c oxidase cbb3-type subunit I/II